MEESVQQKFEQYLKENGSSVTSQRITILNEIMQKKTHFNVESFVTWINSKGYGVSRATIYRTVQQLEDAGILRKMDFDKGYANYEVIPGKEHHEHLVCNECGRIIEFSDNAFERRIRKIAEANDFKMDSHSVKIFGICSKCCETEPLDWRKENG